MLTSKQVRSAQADLDVLFKTSEIMNEAESYKKMSFVEQLRREVGTPSGYKVYLSDRAYASFERLYELAQRSLPSRKLLVSNDVYSACKSVLGEWYERDGIEQVTSYFEGVEARVNDLISDYRFYSVLTGVNFNDIDRMEFGAVELCKPDITKLQEARGKESVINAAWREMQHNLWMTAKVRGSWNYAEKKFFQLTKISCGVLAVAFTLCLERGGAALRLIPGVEGRFKPGIVRWFSVEEKSRSLHYKESYEGLSCVDLNKDVLSAFKECDWFGELSRISQSDSGADLESAVRRGLYWFFDAQADNSAEMKFVKYWSCIECIFSIKDNSGVTKKIKWGLTAVLTCGAYGFAEYEEWKTLQAKVVRLYDLRSSAVHNANHDHVTMSDLVDLSKWAAVVLVEVSMLIKSGVGTRKELKARVDAACLRYFSVDDVENLT